MIYCIFANFCSIFELFVPLVACAVLTPQTRRFSTVFSCFQWLAFCAPRMGVELEFDPSVGVCVGECGENFKRKLARRLSQRETNITDKDAMVDARQKLGRRIAVQLCIDCATTEGEKVTL